MAPCALSTTSEETFEHVWTVGRGNARTAIAHDELGVLRPLTQLDLDVSGEGELECVREQVHHDLGPHHPVHANAARELAIDVKGESARRNRRTKERRNLARLCAEIDELELRRQSVGIDRREIEQRAHEPLQASRVALGHVEIIGDLRGHAA